MTEFKDCRYELAREDNIIRYHPYGVFDVEESKYAIAAISRLIEEVQTPHFAMLIITRDLMGFTEDSADDWREAIVDWYGRGHRALARVDDVSQITYRIFLSNFDDAFRAVMPVRVFDHEDNARTFLTELGFGEGNTPAYAEPDAG